MPYVEKWRRILIAAGLTAVAVFPVAPRAAALSSPTPTTRPATATTLPPVPGVSAPNGAVVESWALAPTANAQSAGGDRPNLSYEVAAGAQIKDDVTLYNLSNIPLTFQLYASDARNTPDGGFDLLPRASAPKDVGTWVVLPQANITLAARQQATIPIVINVPDTATPGDHVGGIVASSTSVGPGPNGKTVLLDRRTGPRLYLRVAGPLNPHLTVENLKVSYHPSLNPLGGSADVSYQVANRGNVRLQGTDKNSVSGPFGLFSRGKPTFALPEVLPGQTIAMHAKFTGAAATFVAFGRVRLSPQSITGTAANSAGSWRALSLALPYTLLVLLVCVWLILRARRAYLRRNPLAPTGRPMAVPPTAVS